MSPTMTALARTFLDRLWADCRVGAQLHAARRAISRVPLPDFDDDDDRSNGGGESTIPEVPVIPPRADRVATAFRLARALQPVRGIALRLETATPVILVRASDPDAVAERIAKLVGAGAIAPARKTVVPLMDLAIGGSYRSDPERMVAVISEQDVETETKRSSTSKPSPSKRGPELVIASVLALGTPVIVVADQEDSALATATQPLAEAEVALPDLDPQTIAATIRIVSGARRVPKLSTEDAGRLTLADLALAVRPGVSASQAVQSLRRIGRARQEESPHNVVHEGPRLEDLAGYGPAQTWGIELARDLEDWRAGRIGWSEVDRGLLLSGPPGTGKTTFARALARSCGVPLIASSVAQWQCSDAHLGSVLKKMRTSFEEAWSQAPAILFLDELDGIGRRDHLSGDYVEYWEQVVNHLLELVDGVCSGEGVILVGATNFPDRIDPALRRAGRLDRHVRVPLPDVAALERIFRTHLEQDLAGEDLRPIARQCLGGTGADVASYVRRARRIARRAGRALSLDDLTAAIAEERPRRSDAVRWVTAVHEAGHAIGTIRLQGIAEVTIAIDRPEGGLMSMPASALSGMPSRDDILAHITVGLCGRAAEDVIVGRVSAGSGGTMDSDLATVSRLAMSLETVFGMGDAGDLLWDTPEAASSRAAFDGALRQRVSALLDEAYTRAKNLITAERDVVVRIAEALMDRGVLEPPEVTAILAQPPHESAKLGGRRS